MKYVKQLDSLRAIAVLLVIFSHWTHPFGFLTQNRLGNIGLSGVDIFFVLSGFLISSILFENKNDGEQNNVPLRTIFINFYCRRALRIFPVFYVTIFILAFLKIFIPAINLTQLFFAATYTINFYFHHYHVWGTFTGHFWSLAVEEQFYVIWPLLVLLVPVRYLVYVIGAFIIIGITGRIFETGDFGFLVTYTCFDAFGMGAALAFVLAYRPALLKHFFAAISVFAIASLFAFVFIVYHDVTNNLWQRTINSVISLWIISFIMLRRQNNSEAGFWLLDNHYMVAVGRISYGMYVYHLYVPALRNFILTRIIHLPGGIYNNGINYFIYLLIDLTLLLLIAGFSWRNIEEPLLRYKMYFRNKKTPVSILQRVR